MQVELENRMHSLTQSLLSKQNNLETITAERNALKFQLEKLTVSFYLLTFAYPTLNSTLSLTALAWRSHHSNAPTATANHQHQRDRRRQVASAKLHDGEPVWFAHEPACQASLLKPRSAGRTTRRLSTALSTCPHFFRLLRDVSAFLCCVCFAVVDARAIINRRTWWLIKHNLISQFTQICFTVPLWVKLVHELFYSEVDLKLNQRNVFFENLLRQKHSLLFEQRVFFHVVLDEPFVLGIVGI